MKFNSKPLFPQKNGGEILRKLFEENQKRSRSQSPSSKLIEIVKRQKIEEEKETHKKSALDTDLDL
ncbi:hypothetical protein D3C87_2065490 [compost metagenome]